MAKKKPRKPRLIAKRIYINRMGEILYISQSSSFEFPFKDQYGNLYRRNGEFNAQHNGECVNDIKEEMK